MFLFTIWFGFMGVGITLCSLGRYDLEHLVVHQLLFLSNELGLLTCHAQYFFFLKIIKFNADEEFKLGMYIHN
jgi:hypothetical protein